jgi:predicted MPP superfamily phosphohydrolase
LPADQEDAFRRPTRRRFLRRAAGAGAAVGAATFGYAWRIEPHWVEIVHRALPIAHLPESLNGKTLIQISDLHIGPVVDPDYITATIEQVSSLRADILTITGDFMTCMGVEQVEAVRDVFKHLRPGKLATIGILGNHDYALQWGNTMAADVLSTSLAISGITMLRNSKTEVQGLQIAGVDDLWGPNFAPEQVMPTLESNQASLVLCHNPDAMDLPVWNGYKGWILSGHTHGGQCSIPFIGPPIIPVRNKRYTSGEFDLHDGRMLYINRGLGYLHRVRFNARPEITVFEMRRA